MFDPIIELHIKLQRNREEAEAAQAWDCPGCSCRKEERTREKDKGNRRNPTA